MTEAESERKSDPIALFDLDGTLADFSGSMIEKMKLIASPEEIAYGTFWEDYQEDEPDHLRERRRLIKRQPGFWRDLPQYTTGMKILAHTIAEDFQIAILTKAPRTNFPAWGEKVEWCHKNLRMDVNGGIQVNLVEEKGLVYGKMLVDDYPPYIERWLKWRQRGLVLMPAHSWNKDFKHPNVIRVEDYEGPTMDKALAAMKEIRTQCGPRARSGTEFITKK